MDEYQTEARDAANDSQVLRDDALQKLEWPRLAAELASYACLKQTRARLESLDPLTLPDAAREHMFDETAEAILFESGSSSFSLEAFETEHVIPALRRRSTLSGPDLHQVGILLTQMDDAVAFAARERQKPQLNFPLLVVQLESITAHKTLSTRIARSIDADGTVLSSASAALANARSRVAGCRSRIQNQLESMLRHSTVRDAVQDTVWNLRDGRYVLPVKVERRREVPGLARGVSQSGSTIFIEPEVLRSAQHDLEEAELQAELEEQKVLREISESCAVIVDDLRLASEVLSHFDELMARAKLARIVKGCRPTFHKLTQGKTRFNILGARHPLFEIEKKNVVPNDLQLGRNTVKAGEEVPKIWVLSGPNAGGKTVAMRTVGIVVLMAKAGLYVPAISADLFSYTDVFVELGDRQSRKDDLSSFSGHLFYMKRMLERAQSSSLFLIDECFVGTDPVIGMALARATLEEFAARGATAIVTTHFSNLKTLSDTDARFFNGSMEFESRELKPTYKLINGLPGQSYAVELATRLGFDASVIDSARSYQGEESQRLEKLLAELHEQHRLIADEVAKQKTEREKLEAEVSRIVAERKEFEKSHAELMGSLEEKIQKRMNLFENTLNIRERQFERQKQRALEDLEERTRTIPTESPTEQKPVERKTTQPSRKEVPVQKNSNAKTLTRFEDLQGLKIRELPPQKKHKDTAQFSDRTHQELLAEGQANAKRVVDSSSDDIHEFRDGVRKLEQGMKELSKYAEIKFAEAESRAPAPSRKHPEYWKPGMPVRHPTFKETGRVLRSVNKQGLVECQFGLIKSKLEATELKTPEDWVKGKK